MRKGVRDHSASGASRHVRDSGVSPSNISLGQENNIATTSLSAVAKEMRMNPYLETRILATVSLPEPWAPQRPIIIFV